MRSILILQSITLMQIRWNRNSCGKTSEFAIHWFMESYMAAI